MSGGGVVLRPYEDADLPRVLEVMAATFAEYGMTFEPDGWDADVKDIGRRYAGARGAFFAGCDPESGRALGFAGVDLPSPGTAEVHRLYIDPAARGRGLGHRLCGATEAWAAARGVKRVELWSDLRFAHAHLLYARRGYALVGQRVIGDPDRSAELGFERELEAGAEAGAGAEGVPMFPAGAPRVHAAREAAEVPIEAALADERGLGHRARMLTAAILDSRALVRAGRMRGTAHEPPHPDEVFATAGGRAVSLLVLAGECAVGLVGRMPGGASIRAVHPLFREEE